MSHICAILCLKYTAFVSCAGGTRLGVTLASHLEFGDFDAVPCCSMRLARSVP